MTDGVRNSADKKFEKDKRARGRKKLNFISYDSGLVLGQDMFVESVKAERSGIEVDHKDILENGLEDGNESFVVRVREVCSSRLFVLEGYDKAVGEPFVQSFRTVVKAPLVGSDL